MDLDATLPAGAHESTIAWFDTIGIDDVGRVGGKNASLGEMYQRLACQGVRVPNGFATTADAYRMFLRHNDLDGRIADLLAPGALTPGRYCMTFDTETYFAAHGTAAFYPVVPVHFEITATDEHYHVPLLLSPYGYSTYRGS